MSSSKGEARGQPDVAAAERKARPFAKRTVVNFTKEGSAAPALHVQVFMHA